MNTKGVIEGTLSSTFLRGLSAYQEALLTGFEGTREEWIDSLKGHEVELRQNGYDIEWKYTDDETWTFLISLEPVSDYESLANRPTYNNDPLEGEVHTKIFSDDNSISNGDINTITDGSDDTIVNYFSPEYVEDVNRELMVLSSNFVSEMTFNVDTMPDTYRLAKNIPVPAGEQIYIGQVNHPGTGWGGAFYSANGGLIRAYDNTELNEANNILTVPQGAAYLSHTFVILDGYNTNWENDLYIIKYSDLAEYTAQNVDTWQMLTKRGLKYLWSKIASLFTGKVDKVEGKGLSTNDYTTAEKNRLKGIEANAQENVIEHIVINKTESAPTNKTVSFSVPTKTSNIQNDMNYPSDAMYVHTDNNYTSAEKNKLANIENNSERNIIVGVSVNGTVETPTDRVVYLTIPVRLSDLLNDENFISDANYVHTDANYTTTEKAKLGGISEGAQVNVLEFIRVNNKLMPIVDKGVSITFPTKASGIQNDMNYVSDANYVHSDNNFSNEDKAHLDYLWQQYGG